MRSAVLLVAGFAGGYASRGLIVRHASLRVIELSQWLVLAAVIVAFIASEVW